MGRLPFAMHVRPHPSGSMAWKAPTQARAPAPAMAHPARRGASWWWHPSRQLMGPTRVVPFACGRPFHRGELTRCCQIRCSNRCVGKRLSTCRVTVALVANQCRLGATRATCHSGAAGVHLVEASQSLYRPCSGYDAVECEGRLRPVTDAARLLPLVPFPLLKNCCSPCRAAMRSRDLQECEG